MITKYSDFIKESADEGFDLFPTSSEDLLIETLQRYYEILSTKIDGEWKEFIDQLGPHDYTSIRLQSRFDNKLIHKVQEHFRKNKHIFREHSEDMDSNFHGLEETLNKLFMKRFSKIVKDDLMYEIQFFLAGSKIRENFNFETEFELESTSDELTIATILQHYMEILRGDISEHWTVNYELKLINAVHRHYKKNHDLFTEHTIDKRSNFHRLKETLERCFRRKNEDPDIFYNLQSQIESYLRTWEGNLPKDGYPVRENFENEFELDQ